MVGEDHEKTDKACWWHEWRDKAMREECVHGSKGFSA